MENIIISRCTDLYFEERCLDDDRPVGILIRQQHPMKEMRVETETKGFTLVANVLKTLIPQLTDTLRSIQVSSYPRQLSHYQITHK